MSALIWTVGNVQPAITQQVTSGGAPVNLSSATATFNMRPVGSTALKVSAAAVVASPAIDGNLQYNWQASDVDTAGVYLVWWDVDVTGSTAIQSIGESIVEFRAHTPVGDTIPGYAELEEVKYSLSLSGQTYADLDIQQAISAASRSIDNECGRFFYADPVGTTSVSHYDATTQNLIIIEDLISLTELALDYSGAGTYSTVVDPTQVILGPYNNANLGKPYEFIQRRISTQYFPSYLPSSVRVTGRHGWPSVPGPIKDAATMLAHRYVRRKREAPFGIMTVGMESARAIRISQSDPDVYQLISGYVRSQPFA